MKVFVFNCPSCGGRLNYDEGTNKWLCSYCKKSFDYIFAKEEKKLTNKTFEEKDIYFNLCSSCNKEYTSLTEASKCIFCGAQNTSDDMIKASMFSDVEILEDSLHLYYCKEDLKGCPDNLLKTYLDNPFVLDYVNCDVLDGFLELKYNNKERKYLFINLIVPNLEYEDYRFMYELGNEGIRNKSIENDYDVHLLEKASKYKNYIRKKKDDRHIEGIINACISTFQQNNGISDINSIKVVNKITIKKGVYIPIYRKSVLVDNKEYMQHIVGDKSFNKTLYLQYPEIKNALQKYNMCRIIHSIFQPLFIISVALLFIGVLWNYSIRDFNLIFPNLIINILLVFSIIATPLSAILMAISSIKMGIYEKSIVIDGAKYYEQIVNNSNYVKVIGD